MFNFLIDWKEVTKNMLGIEIVSLIKSRLSTKDSEMVKKVQCIKN